MTRLTQWLDTNLGHHNQGHLLGLAVFTLGNVDKTLEPGLAASDRRQLVPGLASPGESSGVWGHGHQGQGYYNQNITDTPHVSSFKWD